MTWSDNLQLEVLEEFVSRAHVPQFRMGAAEDILLERRRHAVRKYRENHRERYRAADRERWHRRKVIRGMREKLSETREGLTLHFAITTLAEDGTLAEVDGYVQTGVYEDGRLGELFLKVGKSGDAIAVMDQWAISTSVALQYGAPIDVLLGKFVGTRFEPSGAVRGVEGILRCTSPLDLVARWLLVKYGPKDVA